MGKFVKLAPDDEIPANELARCIEVEGQKIALFKSEDAFCALSDTCTHRGGPLSEGDVEGTEVTCPWHGAKFDLTDRGRLGTAGADGCRGELPGEGDGPGHRG